MASAMYQTPTASQYASAACHLDQRPAWRGVRIDGIRYVVLTSGNSGRVHIVRADARGCGCIWSQRGATPCSHRLAVELAALEDDLRESAQTPAPARRLTIEELMPACRACGGLCERDLCSKCAAELAYAERIAAKRAARVKVPEAWTEGEAG
jgi:hypothetical protein